MRLVETMEKFPHFQKEYAKTLCELKLIQSMALKESSWDLNSARPFLNEAVISVLEQKKSKPPNFRKKSCIMP